MEKEKDKWVQSRYSEEADKWKVLERSKLFWFVQNPDFGKNSEEPQTIALPLKEYKLCKAPGRWEVCTRKKFKIHNNRTQLMKIPMDQPFGVLDAGLRWGFSEKDPEALVVLELLEEE